MASNIRDLSDNIIANALKSGSTGSSRTILRDDDETWVKVPYQLGFGEVFQSVKDDLIFRTRNLEGINEVNSFKGVRTYSDKDIAKIFGLEAQHDKTIGMFSKAYHQDTRVGGNDAINCLWQFNRDDDILHPISYTSALGSSYIGLSRVYTNTTQLNQQICWFTFGVPYYSSILAFHKKAFDDRLTEINTKGFTSDEGSWQIGEIFGEAFSLLAAIPVIPLKLAYETITHNSFQYKINRFYELRARMQLYYKFVDSMLGHWLVAVGMYGNSTTWEGMNITADPDCIPEALKLTGCSIWEIVSRKAVNSGTWPHNPSDIANHKETVRKSLVGPHAVPLRYRNTEMAKRTALAQLQENDRNTDGTIKREVAKAQVDKAMSQLKSEYESYNGDIDAYLLSQEAIERASANATYNEASGVLAYDDDHGKWGLGDMFVKSALGATQFIGFRVDKSTDASESFSNSTAPSAYAEEFNAKVREIAAKAIDSGIKGLDSEDGFLASLWQDIKSIGAGMVEAIKKIDFIGITDLASAACTGVYLDVPEQYSGSDFNKSHSLSFQLRSPYGDKVSIYQSIIVPLFCILAGALPRAGGANSYVQPFLCRVYCKGMFAVPMGIIDSVSIKRGDSEFGWTYDSIPTCVDVNISIKDMSPIMYMVMYDKAFENIFGVDSAFNEYMLTLAGVGLYERISQIQRIIRGATYTAHKVRSRYLNPIYWSHSVSQFTPVQFVASFLPKISVSSR